MNTLNYIGSKNRLLNTIKYVCDKNIKIQDKLIFADLFAGTGTVGFGMLDKFMNVISNDLEYYSYVINNGLLNCSFSSYLKKIINKCNTLKCFAGLMYKNYSPNEKCNRMFFTNDNAKKCDAIRVYIQKLLNIKKITENEYYFLLASLIVSMDKVANTSCVYGAYLKKFKKSALKELKLVPIHKMKDIKQKNIIYNQFIENVIKDKNFDVVYLDPPYNHRQYSSNYSPLNYLAKYDETIDLTGKTGIIKNYNKSNFCSKVKVLETFSNLIKNIDCHYLIISYNDEGLISFDNLKEICIRKGDTKLYKIRYNKFKAQKNVNKKNVYEYIWFIDVNNKNNTFEKVLLEIKK